METQVRTIPFRVELAKHIGTVPALLFQQIHFWLKLSTNVQDGTKWVYNTYAQWQEQLGCFSLRTIQNAVYSLEQENLILSKTFNKKRYDQTKWYTINYDHPLAKHLKSPSQNLRAPSRKNCELSSRKNCETYTRDVHNRRAIDERRATHATAGVSAKSIADGLSVAKTVSARTAAKKLEQKESSGKELTFQDVKNFWQPFVALHPELGMSPEFSASEKAIVKGLAKACRDRQISVVEFLNWSVLNWSSIRKKITWDGDGKKSRLRERASLQEIGMVKKDLFPIYKSWGTDAPAKLVRTKEDAGQHRKSLGI